MSVSSIQKQMATGRFTLPVVVLVCLSLWAVSFRNWSDWGSCLIMVMVGYLIIEANTAFTLIRTRTSLMVALYWFLGTLLFPFHPLGWENVVPLTFALAVFAFFRCYESPHAPVAVFHAFGFIGLGSLLMPQMVYLAPVFLFAMVPFRALGAKSLWASVVGLLTPYWFLFGYAFCFDRMPLFWKPVKEMVHFQPIVFSHLPMSIVVSGVIISLWLVVGCIHYWSVAYMDKTRTRIYLHFLTAIGLVLTLFGVLQPVHAQEYMQMQLIPAAFLLAHLFTLTRNRFSGIFFIVTFAVFILLMLFNLWMHLFNS